MNCPDDGTCHHSCIGSCFRVITCGPLSDVFPDDYWPDDVHGIEHQRLFIYLS